MKVFLKLGILSSAALCLTACDLFDQDNKKNEFYYSNPTKGSITFKVDNKDYTLEPGAIGSVKLSPGMHSIQGSQGDKFDFMVFEQNKGGILNPNNYVYYTLSEWYVVKGHKPPASYKTYNVIINGHELDMPLRSNSATVIDGALFNCQFPLGKPFPEEVTINDKTTTSSVKTKCFDKQELLGYFASEYNEDLTTSFDEDENNNTVNMTFDYTIPKPEFKQANVQKEAEKLVSFLTQINESSNSDIHDKLNKAFHQSMIDFSDKYDSEKTNVAENEYRNQFIHQVSDFRGYGILPK
ncbi:hypothetical protein ABLB84_03355 [Xenorhabdus szentirmaii]|uniref:hypothetical protein n=1 Tax=Xenorhabdus szentirmaii TaxID=290112 RepID=UPI00199B2FC9|nr:hypothetical protein [Xenorhabdus sp. ZM]MBD2805276.1 hypothetical protein [Xenorhabdus sp. ZM]